MLDALGETTHIGRVRARAAERDALALRMRLGRVLGALSLRPSGVPAAAVVCVRRLSAPPLAHAAGAGLRRSLAWEVAVESSLARLVTGAARPARGFVPADAEAVVFFDRAELLACLATDWLAGAASRRWWWQGILKGGDAARALVAAWMGAPEYVPAALELLARDGRAAPFVAALDDATALELTHRIARAHALEEVAGTLAHVTRADDRDGRGDPTTRGDVRRQASPHLPAPAPPWEAQLGGAHTVALGREQECLLGIGLTLARSPARARTYAFARAMRAWREAPPHATFDAGASLPPKESAQADAAPTDSSASASPSPATRGEEQRETLSNRPDAEALGRGVASARRAEPARDDASDAAGASPVARASDDGSLTERVAPSAHDVAASEPHAGEAAFGEARARTEEEAQKVSAQADDLREDAPRAHTPREPKAVEGPQSEVVPRLVEARAETRLGGLFYLINLGVFLELYGDFTTPLQPGLALSVWDFVTLLGRRLCAEGDGPVDESSAEGGEDAVWSLLARLAGRAEGEEPGQGFEAPDEWRVPPAWLKPFPEGGVWDWSTSGGRLRVRHARGFHVLDVKRRRGVGAARQLSAELAAYEGADFGLRRVKARPGEKGAGGGGLARWVSWLAAYARVRLARALGYEPGARASRLLLLQGASVRVTATHLDAYFQLAGLPIEVRLAGLDRDPGWVPAAGRFVAFHYD
jgi:hypothetical protein